MSQNSFGESGLLLALGSNQVLEHFLALQVPGIVGIGDWLALGYQSLSILLSLLVHFFNPFLGLKLVVFRRYDKEQVLSGNVSIHCLL